MKKTQLIIILLASSLIGNGQIIIPIIKTPQAFKTIQILDIKQIVKILFQITIKQMN